MKALRSRTGEIVRTVLQNLFFSEITAFLKQGSRESVSSKTLLPLPYGCESHQNIEGFASFVESGTFPGTLKSLFRLFKNDIRIINILAASHIVFAVATPIFLNRLLHALGHRHSLTHESLYLLVVGLFLSSMGLGLLNEQIFHFPRMLALKVHGTLLGYIGRQVMSVRGPLEKGVIINHASSDCWRLFELFVQRHRLWAVPAQIFLLLVLLVSFLGIAGLVGVAIMLVSSPLSAKIFTTLGENRDKLLKVGDDKIELIADGIRNIRSLKLSHMERYVLEKILEIRGQEISVLRNRVVLTSLSTLVILGSATLVTASSMVVHLLLGHELTAEAAFSTIALFALLQTRSRTSLGMARPTAALGRVGSPKPCKGHSLRLRFSLMIL